MTDAYIPKHESYPPSKFSDDGDEGAENAVVTSIPGFSPGVSPPPATTRRAFLRKSTPASAAPAKAVVALNMKSNSEGNTKMTTKPPLANAAAAKPAAPSSFESPFEVTPAKQTQNKKEDENNNNVNNTSAAALIVSPCSDSGRQQSQPQPAEEQNNEKVDEEDKKKKKKKDDDEAPAKKEDAPAPAPAPDAPSPPCPHLALFCTVGQDQQLQTLTTKLAEKEQALAELAESHESLKAQLISKNKRLELFRKDNVAAWATMRKQREQLAWLDEMAGRSVGQRVWDCLAGAFNKYQAAWEVATVWKPMPHCSAEEEEEKKKED